MSGENYTLPPNVAAAMGDPQTTYPAPPPVAVPAAFNQTAGPVQVVVNGLSLTVDPSALDDVEMFDMLNEFTGGTGQLALIPAIIRGLFGDQYKLVMDAIRSPETHRVSFEAASKFIADTMAAINPN